MANQETVRLPRVVEKHDARLETPELRRLTRARHGLDHASRRDEIAAARLEVDAAAGAARDAGCGWTQIGNVLGIARGCAYQRYRKRPAAEISTLAS